MSSEDDYNINFWTNADDDNFPDNFDPLMETVPDIYSGKYDVEKEVFVTKGREIEVPEDMKQTVTTMVENNQDPTPTLKSVLEELIAKEAPQTIDDAFPQTIFEEHDDGAVFFPDACFAAPYLRSKQKCLQKHLKGYIVIPASFSTRLRSRKGNHARVTPCMYYPHTAFNFAPFM